MTGGGGGGAAGVGGGALEDGVGGGVGVETGGCGEFGVAGGVVAVVGTDDDVGDGLVGDGGDGFDEAAGLGGAALAVGDEDAVVGDDEHADGGEAFVAGRAELLVGIDAGGEFPDAWEVVVGVAADVRVGGAEGGGG